MPGWRRSGFSPRPSAGVNRMLFAGWKVCAAIPAKVLVEQCKRIFEDQLIPRKNAIVIPHTTDHPRQELAVAVPFAQGDQRGEGGHQPGPEEQRAGLSAPPGRDLQIGGHAAAGHFVNELHFVMIVDQQIDQNASGEREQRPGEKHGPAGALHEGGIFRAFPINGSKDTIKGN